MRESSGERLFAVRLRLRQALALWRAGERELAMAICRPALARALHQGLWRSLLEGREEMAALLAEIHKRGAADDALTADIAVLLSRFAAAGIVIDSARQQPLALRLTEREQQTLSLIADGYSNKGVARELGISAETVKWHLKQLYEKLQVKGRIQAVNQAREWRLLG